MYNLWSIIRVFLTCCLVEHHVVWHGRFKDLQRYVNEWSNQCMRLPWVYYDLQLLSVDDLLEKIRKQCSKMAFAIS